MSDSLTPDASSASPIGEILHGPSKFELFLEKNQKLLLVGTIAVAVGIGGYSVMQSIKADTNAEAAGALIAATDLASLESVQTQFPDSPSAATAAFLRAEKLWESGEQDSAINSLKEIIGKYPQHPVVALSRMKLANALVVQGKTADAAALYEEVISDASSAFLAPNAMIALGDLAMKNKEMDKAKGYYQEVETKFEKSKLKQTAQERIRFISFQDPTEVDAPPPPPPASITLPEAPELPKLESLTLDPQSMPKPTLFEPEKNPEPELPR